MLVSITMSKDHYNKLQGLPRQDFPNQFLILYGKTY
jgi:hypothetical protein